MCVKSVKSVKSVHIDERNEAGDTPLGLAVWHNHICYECVKRY